MYVYSILGKGTTTIRSLAWIRSTSETDPGRYHKNYPINRVYPHLFMNVRTYPCETVGWRTWNPPHATNAAVRGTLYAAHICYRKAAVLLVRCRFLRAVRLFRLVGDAWRVSFTRPLSLAKALKLCILVGGGCVSFPSFFFAIFCYFYPRVSCSCMQPYTPRLIKYNTRLMWL